MKQKTDREIEVQMPLHLYVDDMLVSGQPEIVKAFNSSLRSTFKTRFKEYPSDFVGVQLFHNERSNQATLKQTENNKRPPNVSNSLATGAIELL